MRLLLAVAVAGVFAFATASSASAAQTFGSDVNLAFSGASTCGAYPCSVVAEQHDGPRAETGSPISGVLVRVRMRYLGDGADGVFRILRPNGTDAFLNAGPEIPAHFTDTASGQQVFSFDVRHPIRLGDRIAIGADSSFSGDAYIRGGGGAQCYLRQSGFGSDGTHAVDTTQTYTTASCSFEPLIEGTVEPDVDGDGYGDETQDACPSVANTAGPCPDLAAEITASPTSVVRTGDSTYVVTARNTSATAGAPGVTAHVAFPATLDVDVAHLQAGCTAGTADGHDVVDCRLPDLGAGGAATASIPAKTLSIGPSAVAAVVSYAGADPQTANNSASVTTTGTYDTVRRCPAANLFSGAGGPDRLTGTAFSDPIYGGKGNDVIKGLAGDDCIFGDAGADRLDGGPGNDRIDGRAGNDRIKGGSGRDRILGGAGNDTIDASDRGHDRVDCGPGRDKVTARKGDKLKRCERVKIKRR